MSTKKKPIVMISADCHAGPPAETYREYLDSGVHAEYERWLAGVAVGSFVTYSYLMPDILAYPLTAEQKQWQREQIAPVYKRAKEAAGHFLSRAERRNIEKGGLRVKDIRNNADAHRALYAALLRAETDVIGWISTR